jgi:hypothetical protein
MAHWIMKLVGQPNVKNLEHGSKCGGNETQSELVFQFLKLTRTANQKGQPESWVVSRLKNPTRKANQKAKWKADWKTQLEIRTRS